MSEDKSSMTDYILGNDSEDGLAVVYTIDELQKASRACELRATTPPDEIANDYPINNFLRGSLRVDRLRHESNSQHSGLAYWRQNTSKQRDHNENLLHLNLAPRNRYNTGEMRGLEGYGASISPGMGLESENLHSFIVRNRGSVVAVGDAEPPLEFVESVRPVEVHIDSTTKVDKPDLAVVHSMPSELRSGAPAPDIACRFRRMKTATFTNLVARALNE